MTRAFVAVALLATGAAFAQGVPSQRRSEAPTWTSVQEPLLGQPFSADALTLTQSNPSLPTLTLAGGRFYLYPPGDAANSYMYFDGQSLRLVFAGVILGGNVPLTVDILTSTVPSTMPVTVEAAAGHRLSPQAAVLSCVSGLKGQSTVLSSDGRTYYCDGTTSQRVGFTLSNSASLDFPSINNNEDATLTMTVTGAASGDSVQCNPTGSIETGLQVSYAYVSATNTVTVVVHDASGGTVNPAAATYRCTIMR